MSTFSNNPLNAPHLLDPNTEAALNSENGRGEVPQESIDALNRLVQLCIDTRESYEQAADTVETDRFRKMFTEYAEQRNQFATQISNLILQYDGQPQEFGTDSGSIRRGWENIRATLSPTTEESVLDSLESGEDKAKEIYETALNASLPEKAREVVQRQYETVLRVHNEIRDLRNAHTR